MKRLSVREIAGLAIMSASLLLPIASTKATRIDRGSPLYLWDLPRVGLLVVFAVPLAVMIVNMVFRKNTGGRNLSSISRMFWSLLPASLIFALSSIDFTSSGSGGTRLGLGAGFWLMSVSSAILGSKDGASSIATAITATSLIICAYLGLMDDISLYRELFSRRSVFLSEVSNHLKLAFLSALAAVVPGVLLGYWCHVSAKARKWVMGSINLLQVLPTLSLLGLIMLPLASLSKEFSLLADIGIRGIGFAPAFIALGLYCLLPVTANTLAGFSEVDKKALFSAEAMGMTKRQILIRIQIPLAFPVIFSGIRTAMSQNIGNATIAGLVGGGGMGTLIFLGLSQAAPDLVLLGALPVITMAILLDGSLGYVEKWIQVAVLHGND